MFPSFLGLYPLTAPSWPDIKVIQLILDLDGREVTKSEVLSKIEELGLISELIPSNAHQILKAAYYRGAFESLYDYVFPIFCSIERKNKDTVTCIALRPGVRERLVEVVQEQGGMFNLRLTLQIK